MMFLFPRCGWKSPLLTQTIIRMNHKVSSPIKAVIFDMGGVLIPSPGRFFADFETKMQIPRGSLVRTIVSSGDEGAWAKLERGDINLESFGVKFKAEYLKETGEKIDATNMLSEMVKYFSIGDPDPIMMEAIKCLKRSGFKTALLTNNFYLPNEQTFIPVNVSLFDVVVESAKTKMRKPERRIYEKVLHDLQVSPAEAVFLDDLGHNLKTAKELGISTIKVENSSQALSELERIVAMDLRNCVLGVSEVPTRLKIDTDKLKSYLKEHLHLSETENWSLKCFDQGQSNPTYFMSYGGSSFVLRKKPPGQLLPTAHMIEREYRVMEALKHTDVPVPRMISFCSDDSVLGTPFYLMQYMKGTVFKDPMMPGFNASQKTKVMQSVCKALAAIHKTNYKDLGLEDFGSKGSYISRNLKRWWKQYELNKSSVEIENIPKIYQWLVERIPTNERVTLVHGDYRIDNLIFDPITLEVQAVIDWELSTLGDPLTDLANSCVMYLLPRNSGLMQTLDMTAPEAEGIPQMDEYLEHYFKLMNTRKPFNWDFYVVFVCFRITVILQGVYKRFLDGQASSPNANLALGLAQLLSEKTWNLAQRSSLPLSLVDENSSGGSGALKNNQSETSNKFGLMPVNVESLGGVAQSFHQRVKNFINNHILPLEQELYTWHSDPVTKWKIHPKIEELKNLAKSDGLWNLFIPQESDEEFKYGKGFSNVEYAFMAEEMGRTFYAPEIFNCSAPDTGNMEVLIRYGNKEQKIQWLQPLLEGKIRSCFAMTEPNVASSDATNIESSIKKDGSEYVINGHKWWTSGAMDPRCKMCIFMGKTDKTANIHKQQSMIIVPMDSPGVKVVRPLLVFGFDDAPHGHAEVIFDNVRVPEGNLILGEGRGFEIAQGRLGPGRIHHCMRILGAVDRCLQLMIERTQKRVAFGKPLIEQGVVQRDIAEARIKIEPAKLLVLKAAHIMDVSGNKAAAMEIAMVKSVVPEMACEIINRAIQSYGAMGVCQDVVLPQMYIMARSLCIADGPSEVHLKAIAKMEIKKFNSKI